LPSDPTSRLVIRHDDAEVEAARHVLFGRILPSLRHSLVGELQALRFGVGIVRASSSPTDVETALSRLTDQATRSIERADAIAYWYQPDPEASIELQTAINECLDLVHGDWQMRGILVAQSGGGGTSRVRSRAFREVVMACLLALGDDLNGAADVALKVRRRGEGLWLTLRGDLADREGERLRAPLPRALSWSDVDALAGAHSVTLRRRGRRIAARFPIADGGS
jgi:hypothetical protein